jgi:transposase
MPVTAHFTPSLLDEQSLEQLFVNREEMLDAVIERIREASASGRLPHVLYVGPRGAGKTHLVSLIYYRAKRLNEFGRNFAVAWLPEDAWGIISFESLMAEIEKNTEAQPESEPLQKQSQGKSSGQSHRQSHEQPRPPLTVVLVENLDRVFSALGTEGQQRLRAHIEREEDMLLVATSTRLTDYLIEQAQPFYGFFDTIELEPFTLDEAITMLQQIARFNGDQTLATRLGEPDTRARLAAVERLAGGQPRIWAFLAAGLTAASLKDFVDVLLGRFDDLTPYYQEQLGRLSPHELQAVWTLIEHDGAMTVQALAEATGIEQQSLATTLRRLRPQWIVPREGYLMQFVDKRTTYYQLAEPLARLAFQIKASKGRPIRLAVDFLAAWYSRDELNLSSRGMTERFAPSHSLVEPYLEEARLTGGTARGRFREHLALGVPTLRYTERYPAKPDEAVVEECTVVDAALARLQHEGNAEAVLALPAGIAESLEDQLLRSSVGFLRMELALLAARSGGGNTWLTRALDSASTLLPEEEKAAQLIIGSLRLLLGSFDAGLSTYENALGIDGSRLTTREWEIVATTIACPVRPVPVETRITVLCMVAPFVADTDLPTLVSLSLEEVPPATASKRLLEALCARIAQDTKQRSGTIDELLEVLYAHVDVHAQEWLVPRARIAWWRYLTGGIKRSLKELDEVIVEARQHPDFDIAKRLELQADRERIAAETGEGKDTASRLAKIVEEAEQALGPDHPNTLTTRHNLAYRTGEAGRAEEAAGMLAALLEDEARVLGADHPHTLATRHSLAWWTGEAGRAGEAAEMLAALLEDRVRVLGADHPDTLTTRHNLACFTGEAGRAEEAAGMLTALLEDRARVLGSDHPRTISTRNALAYWARRVGRTDKSDSR